MHIRRMYTALGGLFLACVAVISYDLFESNRQYKALQASLGTTEDPIQFMGKQIKLLIPV